MAEARPRKTAASRERTGADEDGAAEKSQGAAQRFIEFLGSLTEAAGQRQGEVANNYFGALQAALQQAQNEAFTRAYQDLLKAVQNQNPEELAIAQSSYLESMRKVQASIEASQKSSLSDYLTEIQRLNQDIQDECRKSFDDYLQDLKSALSSAPGDMSPAELAAVGQSMVAVAGIAASVLPQQPASSSRPDPAANEVR